MTTIFTIKAPTECFYNVAAEGPAQWCRAPAAHWYEHNMDICSYCEEHNYACGRKIPVGADGRLILRFGPKESE